MTTTAIQGGCTTIYNLPSLLCDSRGVEGKAKERGRETETGRERERARERNRDIEREGERKNQTQTEGGL